MAASPRKNSLMWLTGVCSHVTMKDDFRCQVDWAKGYQDSWQNPLFVSKDEFLEEISLLTYSQSKEHCLHLCGGWHPACGVCRQRVQAG